MRCYRFNSMLNKRLIVVLIMLFIAVGAVSAVSASDLNATDDAAIGDKLQTTEENTVLQEDYSVESGMSQNIIGAGEISESNSSQEVENTTVSDTQLSLSASKVTTTYGVNKYFKVKVVDSQKNPVKGVKVKISIYTSGKRYVYMKTTDANGIASLNVKSIAKGNYKVDVSISDDVYTAKSIQSAIKVNQKALKIIAKSKKFSSRDFAGGVVEIQVKDKSSNKGLNGISLTLKIFTGKKYKTVKLVSGYDRDDKKNGAAGIFTNKYSVGTHKVKITPTSSNYKGSATAKLVIAKNAKKNYYNFHLYFTKGKNVFKLFK